MLKKTLIWNSDCEKALEDMVNLVRDSIISNAELCARSNDLDCVDYKSLELSLYKSIMTLNEVNKSIIFRTLGFDQGQKIISAFEENALQEVTGILYEEVMEKYDEYPPEIQKLLDSLKNKMNEEKGYNQD